MAKNIEININTSGSYETLYPVTDYNQLLNKPTIPTVPSLPLSVANGGHASTTASGGVYNLVNPLSTRSASQLNSYASSTYIPCTYSTGGYKFPLNNILNYIQNNISSGGSKIVYGIYTGTGTIPTLTFSELSEVLFFIGVNAHNATVFGTSYYTHMVIWYKTSTATYLNCNGICIHAKESIMPFIEATGDADFIGNQIRFRSGGGKITSLYDSGEDMEWVAMGN